MAGRRAGHILDRLQVCQSPEHAVEYWRLHIATSSRFNSECECLVVLMLNAKKRVKGHQLISVATPDSLVIHPREVLRAAVTSAAASIVLVHNHPIGKPEPSEADIRATRAIIKAGHILHIEVADHIIIGNARHVSLRRLGFFPN